jgi:PhnB protein
MVKAKSAIPEGFRSLTPYLIVDSAKNFLEFIRDAFGASEKFLARDKSGAIRHAEARIGDSIIEFAEAGPG